MEAYIIEHIYSQGYDRSNRGIVLGTKEDAEREVARLDAEITGASFSVDSFVRSWRGELEDKGVPIEVTLTLRPPEDLIEKGRREAHKRALAQEYHEAWDAEILSGAPALTG